MSLHQFYMLITTVAILEVVTALPRPETLPNDAQSQQNKSGSWSKEAILTLLGVGTAIICFVIGLAWPKLRRSLSTCMNRKFWTIFVLVYLC